MTSDAQLKKTRLRKLNPRAHIGYLVGCDSTNIYRTWIPHNGIVISTRDIIFDEKTFFDNRRTHLSDELIAKLDSLIEKIKLPDASAGNEAILEDDEQILEISHQDDDDDMDAEPIQDFNEVEDLELAKALEDAYLTPPTSEEDDDSPYAFHVQYPIDQEIQDHVEETGDRFNSQGVFGDEAKVSFNAACNNWFEDLCEKVTSTYYGSSNAGRKFNLDS
jgi:hypothetical protein